MISDFGTYSVKNSLSALRRGKDVERDTPEPMEEDDEGRGEEDALREAFGRKGFVIHLEGRRYTIRLSMKYQSSVATGT